MAYFAFLIYLLLVLVRPQEFIPSLAEVPVVQNALIAVFVLHLLQKNKRYDGPHTWQLPGLVVATFLSWLFNGWIGGGAFAASTTLATGVLPFFIIINVVNTRQRLTLVMQLMVIAAIVMVSNAISQKAAEDTIGWAGVPMQDGGRAAYLGIFNDPNDMSMFLVMTLPLAVFLFKSAGVAWRLFYGYAAVLIVYGVYLTNSRGGLVGLLGLGGFWFLLTYGIKRTVLLGFAAIPAAVLALSRFREIDPSEESAFGRLAAWYQGIQMLVHKPLFGVGHGAFTDYHELTAHNSFVLVFAELGLFGYFFWLGFVLFCGLAVWAIWREHIASRYFKGITHYDKAAAKALTFSMLGFLITGFFLSRAYTPILYIFCGLMIALFYIAVPKEEASHYLRFKYHAVLFAQLFFGSVIFVYLSVKVLI